MKLRHFEVGLALSKVDRSFCTSLLSDFISFHRLTSFPPEPVAADPLCGVPFDLGPCRNYEIRWYYDRQANACAKFWYGGCEGNKNRFNTEEECKRTCVKSSSAGTLSVFSAEISKMLLNLLHHLLFILGV